MTISTMYLSHPTLITYSPEALAYPGQWNNIIVATGEHTRERGEHRNSSAAAVTARPH